MCTKPQQTVDMNAFYLNLRPSPVGGRVEEAVLGVLRAIDAVEDADAVAGRLGGDVARRVGREHDVEGHVPPHGLVARPQPGYHLKWKDAMLLGQ